MPFGLDYGYRSKCCYAPIKFGRKTIKKTNKKISIWICCKCGARDVDIVEYTKGATLGSSPKNISEPKFISEEEEEPI